LSEAIGFFEDVETKLFRFYGLLKPLYCCNLEGLSLVEATLHSIKPDIVVFFMTSEVERVFKSIYLPFYEKLLKEKGVKEVLVNPREIDGLVILNARLKPSNFPSELIKNLLNLRGNQIILSSYYDIVLIKLDRPLAVHLLNLLRKPLHIELLMPFRDLIGEIISDREYLLKGERELTGLKPPLLKSSLGFLKEEVSDEIVLDESEGPIVVEEEVEIKGTCVLRGPLFIRESCKIEDSVIEGSSLGFKVSVKNSIIRRSIVGDFSTIRSSTLIRAITGDFVDISHATLSSPRISSQRMLSNRPVLVGDFSSIQYSGLYSSWVGMCSVTLFQNTPVKLKNFHTKSPLEEGMLGFEDAVLRVKCSLASRGFKIEGKDLEKLIASLYG